MALTKKQKEQLVADYVTMRSYRKVGEKYGISHAAAAKIVNENRKLYNELTLLETEIVVNDLKEFMETRKDVIASIMNLCLLVLSDPDKMREAPPNQVMQVLGGLYDRFVTKDAGTNIENAGVVILPAQTEVRYSEDGSREV